MPLPRNEVTTSSPGELWQIPLYAHVAEAGPGSRLVHISGQIGVDKNGIAPADYIEQIKLALQNLDACLKSVGARRKDVVKQTYYIVNYDASTRLHVEPIMNFYQGHRPATTLVPVPKLARDDLLFEVEAVVAVPVASPWSMMSNRPHPVVVIGAGLSGLQAAYDLERQGISCLVLEARNRVGGKTWSAVVQGGKGIAELGAAWINDVNQPRAYALAQKLGLELIEQNTKGNVMMHGVGTFPYGGVPAFQAKSDQDGFVKARDEMERLCHTIDVLQPQRSGSAFAQMTVDDLVKSWGVSQNVRDVASIWTKAMLGKDSTSINALYFLLYCKAGGGFLQMRSDSKGGGQALRFRKGTQSLARGLADSLLTSKIRLEHPVQEVKQLGKNECQVICKDGTVFACERVIVSLPSPLYPDITFSPPLSQAKQTLAKETSFGYYGKCILIYTTPWWRELGFCGLAQATSGPFSIARDTSSDADGVYELTCFTVGVEGARWSQLPAPRRLAAILEHLDAIYGRKCPEPIEVLESMWVKEEYFKGAPCPTTDGSSMHLLDEGVYDPEGNIHFVGTETSPLWKGYMEGALTSGARGAAEVMSALRESGSQVFRPRL